MKSIVRGSQVVALAVVAGMFAVNTYAAAPCFVAKGNTVTVMDLPAKKGAAHDIDVEHMTNVSSMVSNGPVANDIQISNIKRDAAKNVTTFDATIDGKAYSYPKDICNYSCLYG